MALDKISIASLPNYLPIQCANGRFNQLAEVITCTVQAYFGAYDAPPPPPMVGGPYDAVPMGNVIQAGPSEL